MAILSLGAPACADDEHDLPKFKLEARADANSVGLASVDLNREPDAILQFKSNCPYRLISSAVPLTAKGGDRPGQFTQFIAPELIPVWPLSPKICGVDSWIVFITNAPKPTISFADTAAFTHDVVFPLPKGWALMYSGGSAHDRMSAPRGWVQEVKVGRRYQYKVWLDFSALPAENRPRKEGT
jgi:hypothetical protein